MLCKFVRNLLFNTLEAVFHSNLIMIFFVIFHSIMLHVMPLAHHRSFHTLAITGRDGNGVGYSGYQPWPASPLLGGFGSTFYGIGLWCGGRLL